MGLFIAFQILVFFPALQKPTPWSDDWGYIFYNNVVGRSIFQDTIASGRPILGFAVESAYKYSFVTSNLIIIHLLALFGLLLLQLEVYKKLLRNGFSDSLSILSSLTLILIPGFQGYVYFLSCFPYAWACLLGFLSYDLLNGHKLKEKVAGFLLIIVSLLVYPAGAMFYFLSYFIEFIVRFKGETPILSNVRHLIGILAKFFSCLLLGALLAKIVLSIYGVNQASRVEFVDSLPSLFDKAIWVVSRLFVSEFRIFTVSSPTAARAAIESAIVFLLLVFFILKPHQGFKLNKCLNFALMLLVPLLGALPNLFIRENQFEFRTLTATYSMSLILWVYCFDQFLQNANRDRQIIKSKAKTFRQKIIPLTWVPLVLLTAFQVQGDSKDLWVKPSLVRDELTLKVLKNLNFDVENSICMVIPDEIYAPLNKLGVYSMRSDLVSPWVPGPYVRLQLELLNKDFNEEVLVQRNPKDCNPKHNIIDYGPIRNIP